VARIVNYGVRKIFSRAGVVNQWILSRKLQTFVFMEYKNHIFNSKYLEANRKWLRNNSTSAEAALWTLLKINNWKDESSEGSTVLVNI
jgi:hypothetical protein